MIFCTANSLNNPFQKDCVINKAWVGSAGTPAPFGDYLSFDQTDPYAQPIVTNVTATAPSSCSDGYALTATVQDTLAVSNGVVIPTVKAVDFYYWYDADGDGTTSGDPGSVWTRITPTATLKSGSLNTWTTQWVATSLPKGKFLIGVQAVDDNTKVDDGMTPTGIDNRTFSYVVGDAQNRIYVGGASYASVPAHSPAMVPGATEDWYGNPAVTGVQTALVGVALNNCGVAPSLAKTASASNVVAGGTVDFTLTVSNPMGSSITVSQITDVLPAGFSYNSNQPGGTLSPSTSPTANATGTITWGFSPVATLNAGASATLIFRANVASVPGTYSNTATATTSFGTLTSDPVQLSVGTPRLTISKTPSTFSTTPGSTVTYTISYSNDSPANTTDVTITDTLPTGLTYVSTSCTGACTYTSGTKTISWTIGSLASGEGPNSVTFQATVDNPYTGAATNQNTATIKSPQTTDASSTASVYVDLPRPLLTLKKTASVSLVAPGNNVTFTLNYANSGNATSTNTVVSDPLPSGFTFVSATGSPTSAPSVGGNGTVTWTIGTLAAGASGSVTVTAMASNPFTGTANPATNTASISSTEVTTPVTDSADVGVTQSGQLCRTYYMSNQQGNVGFDGTQYLANTTTPSGATTTIAKLADDAANPGIIEIARFYQDPVSSKLVAFDGSSTLGGQLDYVKSTSLGGSANSNSVLYLTVYDYNPATGATVQIAQSTKIDNGAPTPPVSLTGVTPVGQLSTGHRALIVMGVDMAANKATTIELRANSINSYVQICAPPPANLILDKTASAASVQNGQAGQTITYTLNYANTSGSTAATNVVLSDALPAGTTYASSSPSATTNPGVGNNGTVTWNLGTVAAGGSGSVTVTVNVATNLSAYNLLTNTSSIISDQTAAVTTTASTTVLGNGDPGGTPNVIISKQASDTLLIPGNTVTYTLTAVNAGSKIATSVVVTDNFPDETYFTYGSCSTATGTCSESPSGTLTWNLGSLAPGANATLTFTMTVGANPPSGVTTKDNTASLTYSGGGAGSATSNTVTVSISTNPNLSLSKSANPSAGLKTGDTITYTLTVSNTGSGSASDVVVTDPIPTNLSFNAITQGTGSFDAINNRVVFTAGTLAAGGSTTLKFTATVNTLPAGSTTISNTATVTASNASSRTTSATPTASASPTLTLSKTAPAQVAHPTATLTAAASSTTTLFVNDTTQFTTGQYVSVGGTTVQIISMTGNTITVGTAVTAPSGTDIIGSITYSLTYQNTGAAVATAAILTDTLPGGSTFVAATNGGSHAGGTVSWNLGNIDPNASRTVQVVIIPGSTGTLTNPASINCTGCSGPTGASADTSVGGLKVTKKTTTPTTAAPGTVIYITEIENTLGTAANGVTVTDTLPSGFGYASTTSILIDGNPTAATTSPTVGDNSLTWTSFSIPGGKKLVLTFTASVAASVGAATYQNDAGATSTNASGTPFDPLLTTAEDVTVLADNTGIVKGYVFQDNNNNGVFEPSIDTPLTGVRVNITDSTSTLYTIASNGDGYFSRVVAVGNATVDIENGDLPAGLVLGSGFSDPAVATVPDGGSVIKNTGYVTAASAADLVIGKTNSASSVNAGGGTSYTITVTNNGPE